MWVWCALDLILRVKRPPAGVVSFFSFNAQERALSTERVLKHNADLRGRHPKCYGVPLTSFRPVMNINNTIPQVEKHGREVMHKFGEREEDSDVIFVIWPGRDGLLIRSHLRAASGFQARKPIPLKVRRVSGPVAC
ncbi:hypothetical protein AVEN_235401-1 [Araneus ventricosus]|uniref:Uncharacterized protein n=1 Tax=Araneus ventricosus TaxID=182803 RepID=A0A4Y2A529_ARAVE|nr:hypothetical protein AVEN_235401-1 [Araneus ventricosus]